MPRRGHHLRIRVQHRALARAHTRPFSLSRASRAKCACRGDALRNFESAFNDVNNTTMHLLISVRDNPKGLPRFDRAALERLCLDQRIVSETTELRPRFKNWKVTLKRDRAKGRYKGVISSVNSVRQSWLFLSTGRFEMGARKHSKYAVPIQRRTITREIRPSIFQSN
jgi:hypothetical protein